MSQDISPWRPKEVQDNLTAGLGAPLKRLAFRCQSVPSQTQGFEIIKFSRGLPEHFEWGGFFLGVDMNVSFGTNGNDSLYDDTWRLRLARLTSEPNMNAQTPTMLDVISALPRSKWSKDVRNFGDLFERILKVLQASRDTIWPNFGVINLMEDRLTLCKICMFIQRVISYIARLFSKSLEDYMHDLRMAREMIGVPVNFDLAELHDVKICYHEQRNEIQECFSGVSDLEWVSPTIPVSEVLTTIENPNEIQCIICGCELSSDDLLTVPCLHAICDGCLEHWIHAAQNASHTCPYCRTELFSKPEYRPKHVDRARNYEAQIDRLESLMIWRDFIGQSAAWFNAELAMQRLYELETSSLLAAN
ncbi:hypothetical protein G6011_03418 [Alternaria panax]|uniref:RING-type domain-containing protein n=1 Tax=Alternaria panax TaxID=48097 RepID=A0AAD4IES4_9PLEO|nr:hypothetical protein G6011_03418 [Alternaria panax]